MKKLCKSIKNRKICGVCGGIAEYLNADPTLIRLAFILISMAAGSGLPSPGVGSPSVSSQLLSVMRSVSMPIHPLAKT